MDLQTYEAQTSDHLITGIKTSPVGHPLFEARLA